MHIAHNCRRIALYLRIGHGKQRKRAVTEGRRCSQRNKSIHIRRAVPQAFETTYEKLLIYDHDDDRQKHLHKAHRHMVIVKKTRQRPAPHHMPHREIHEDYKKSERSDEPLF